MNRSAKNVTVEGSFSNKDVIFLIINVNLKKCIIRVTRVIGKIKMPSTRVSNFPRVWPFKQNTTGTMDTKQNTFKVQSRSNLLTQI